MARDIACDLSVFSPEERQAHEALSEKIFSSAVTIENIQDGYRFELPQEFLLEAAQFIAGESRCCPFFNFGIQLTDEKKLYLSLSGDEEIKAFVKAAIIEQV